VTGQCFRVSWGVGFRPASRFVQSLGGFSGLVAALGTLEERQSTTQGLRLGVRHSLGELSLGESIAVSGVCLTVVKARQGQFWADVSSETLDVTSLGHLPARASLNLERALRVGDRLGGHLLSGHVDGQAQVRRLEPHGDAVSVTLGAPAELAAYIAAKGSVALDGVSLTVNEVRGELFEVMLIPHTRKVTTLGALSGGSMLNLEVDLLSRYVCRWLDMNAEPRANHGPAPLEDALRRAGLMRST